MARAEARLKDIDAQIADPDFYTDAHKETRPALLAEHGELSKAHQALEDDWLQVQEAIEAIEREPDPA